MSTRRQKIDTNHQLDLFRPVADSDVPGGLDIDRPLRELITVSIKRAPISRWHISAAMSESLGSELTKTSLDSWTCETKAGHRFPAAYLPAFTAAVCDCSVIDYIARKCGGIFVPDARSVNLELGMLAQEERRIRDRRRELMSKLEVI